MTRWAIPVISFLLLGISYVSSEGECPCKLKPSTNYPEWSKWDCENRALIEVPDQCGKKQSRGVVELVLTNNLLESFNASEFAWLPDLLALYVDINILTEFSEDALQGIPRLHHFQASSNVGLKLPYEVFGASANLMDIHLVSSRIGTLPNLKNNSMLETLDCRSCDLYSLPRPLFGSLTGDTFFLNLIGNHFDEVAADSLLQMPPKSLVFLDTHVTIWAVDEIQRYEVLRKEWDINLDLTVSLKVCYYNDEPIDPSVC